MKKLIVILILCLITGAATVHAAYQRQNKKPNFFMPANAVTNTQQHNIPKQQILRQNKRVLNNLGIKPQSDTYSLSPSPAQAKKQKSQNPVKEQNKTAAKPAAIQPVPEPAAIQPVSKPVTTTADHPPVSFGTISADDTPAKQTQQKSTAHAPAPAPEKTTIAAQTVDEAYEERQKEYKNDLQNIAKGLTVENPRLSKMTKDFIDEEHKIHIPAL